MQFGLRRNYLIEERIPPFNQSDHEIHQTCMKLEEDPLSKYFCGQRTNHERGKKIFIGGGNRIWKREDRDENRNKLRHKAREGGN